MNAFLIDNDISEPERYELYEHAADWDWTRREFFRIVGGGVVVALLLGDRISAQPPGGRGQRGGDRPQEIGAWLHIGEDSTITCFTGKVEIGQNIRTSLTQVVAEELNTPMDRIKMVMADTGLVPNDGGTAGSRTTPDMAAQLRRVAAAAREALLDLALEHTTLPRDSIMVNAGSITETNGKPLFPFGQLTKGKKLMKVVAAGTPTRKPDEWKVAGTSAQKVDGSEFVTGKHEFASDIRRPGMLFGKVLRPPAFKTKLDSVETKDAEALPGVKVIRDGEFVGVVAPTEQLTEEGRQALKAQWQPTQPQPSARELFTYLKEHPGGAGGRGGGGGGRGGGGPQGSIDDGLKAADKTLNATYNIAYIAHVPMEPRAAVAEWEGDKLTVWTGTQMPFRVRTEVASALNLSPDRVRIIVPDMGSGYGGKHSGEVAVEAARLAKAAGKPVKLVWTREEEFTWAYFRPAGVIDIKSGVKSDGMLTAWEFHNYNSGGSAIATPYDVPNRRTEFHPCEYPLRQGSYRALASTANTFARESHMDDLAKSVGVDPLAFRLKNLKEPRLRAVLEAAAKQFGWVRVQPAKDRGVGLACGTEKGSVVATCAEVAIERGQVRVVRTVTAFECGAIVNPDHLRNQVEGCLVMGLGGALFEHIEFEHGKILNPGLTDYRVPRFRDIPQIDVVLLDRKDLPSAGAGETPIVGIAPAIGNAIFQATGIRLRSLPMVPDGLKV
jgi:isoquinoline 1-oxidoreductase